MRVRFTAPPGISLRGIGLQSGEAHGIEVDNPSGSWLYIPSIESFVPPYTLGWSATLTVGAASVDIIAQAGPAGQVSTQTGDPVIVTLSTEPVASSPGSPDTGHAFVNREQQPEFIYIRSSTTASDAILKNTDGFFDGINRRTRLYKVSLFARSTIDGAFPRLTREVQARCYIDDLSGTFFDIAYLAINPNKPQDSFTFQPPLDFPYAILSTGVPIAAAFHIDYGIIPALALGNLERIAWQATFAVI